MGKGWLMRFLALNAKEIHSTYITTDYQRNVTICKEHRDNPNWQNVLMMVCGKRCNAYSSEWSNWSRERFEDQMR
jgi:hypothetical protein